MFNQNAKDNLVRYVSGNLTKEEKPNVPQWGQLNSNDPDFYDKLKQRFPGGFIVQDYLQGKDINGNYNDNAIAFYGYYYNLESDIRRGFVAICTTRGNVLQIITEFTSGVQLGYIYTAEVAEKGKIVAVEENMDTNIKRYLYLNNFLVPNADNKYEVKIRESRTFPSEYPYSDIKIDRMYRNIHEDECIFAGTYERGDPRRFNGKYHNYEE